MSARAILTSALLVASLATAGLAAGKPSRAAAKGCTWELLSDKRLGLEAWVQRCNFGSRRINLLVQGNALAIHYSDGGEPEPLIEVLALLPQESEEAGVKRIFAMHTDKKVARRCVLAPYTGSPGRSGAKRYTFVADAAYAKELKDKEDPNEVGDPACGEWGDAPDGIQYFEVQPGSGARKILFVRVGQDEPLFDEQTLRLLPK